MYVCAQQIFTTLVHTIMLWYGMEWYCFIVAHIHTGCLIWMGSILKIIFYIKIVHQCSLIFVPAACQFKIQIQTLKYYCKSNDTLSYYFTFIVRRPWSFAKLQFGTHKPTYHIYLFQRNKLACNLKYILHFNNGSYQIFQLLKV